MKHAFLIMAHDNFDILELLVRKLDCADHNIYVHVDKKSNFKNREKNKILNLCKKANVYIVPRINVVWGGYSQIECELLLLNQAIKDGNDYYHFLSGVDLPIKSMKKFHEFIERNRGKQFMSIMDQSRKERYELYHFFQNIVGRGEEKHIMFSVLEESLLNMQIKLGIDRTKRYPNIVFRGGSNWCSITKSFAKYVLRSRKTIRKIFKYTKCCDEFFCRHYCGILDIEKRYILGKRAI